MLCHCFSYEEAVIWGLSTEIFTQHLMFAYLHSTLSLTLIWQVFQGIAFEDTGTFGFAAKASVLLRAMFDEPVWPV